MSVRCLRLTESDTCFPKAKQAIGKSILKWNSWTLIWFNKRLESFASCFSQSLLLADCKESHTGFNSGKMRVENQKPRLKMPFRNSISGFTSWRHSQHTWNNLFVLLLICRLSEYQILFPWVTLESQNISFTEKILMMALWKHFA
jgi:hypothetical protein